jgi:hypothetical protein
LGNDDYVLKKDSDFELVDEATYILVPFDSKETAKVLKARWDNIARHWYVKNSNKNVSKLFIIQTYLLVFTIVERFGRNKTFGITKKHLNYYRMNTIISLFSYPYMTFH